MSGMYSGTSQLKKNIFKYPYSFSAMYIIMLPKFLFYNCKGLCLNMGISANILYNCTI